LRPSSIAHGSHHARPFPIYNAQHHATPFRHSFGLFYGGFFRSPAALDAVVCFPGNGFRSNSAISTGVPLAWVNVANVTVRSIAGRTLVRTANRECAKGAITAKVMSVVCEERRAVVITAVAGLVALDLLADETGRVVAVCTDGRSRVAECLFVAMKAAGPEKN